MSAALNDPKIAHVLSGYKRFRENGMSVLSPKFAMLSNEGQNPHTCLVGCSDSRADGAIIFDTEPGDIFSVRNVANMIPAYKPPGESTENGVVAAIEYAVTALKTPLLLVMGHSQCGGCAHALNVVTKNRDLCVAMHGEGGVPSTVDRWCFTMKEAVCGVIDKFDPQIRGRQLELENVRLSVKRVSEYPWVKDAVKAGTLQVRGAFFQVFDGRLFVLGTDDDFYDAGSGGKMAERVGW